MTAWWIENIRTWLHHLPQPLGCGISSSKGLRTSRVRGAGGNLQMVVAQCRFAHWRYHQHLKCRQRLIKQSNYASWPKVWLFAPKSHAIWLQLIAGKKDSAVYWCIMVYLYRSENFLTHVFFTYCIHAESSNPQTWNSEAVEPPSTPAGLAKLA